ncbi:MAG: polyphosphate--glucose phosphotransferase [Puniceicoccales bacterium]
MKAIGIDIGGSRIKAAVVDTVEGAMLTKRQRIDTPRPATPKAVIEACEEVVKPFGEITRIGVGFPGVVRDGTVLTAQNLHPEWIGFSLEESLSLRLKRPVKALNDADAAGVAEIRFGAGAGVDGSVILLTIGTGLGSALFTDGNLVQNTEFGRMFFGRKREAEAFVSETAKDRDDLSNEEWAERFEEYLAHLEALYWPKLIIVGGGGAKKFPEVKDLIKTRCELRHATSKNKAGIIGAALWAAEA